MQLASLVWLPETIEKLEIKHQVTVEEVEEVFLHRPLYRRGPQGERQGENLYKAYGQTEAGRYLFIVFIYKLNRHALILSARDMTEAERRVYRRRYAMAKLPELTTLDDVVAFWESHDSAAYWDDMTEVAFDVQLHTNLWHPRLITLTRRPEHCPRCQQPLDEVSIEYVTWNTGHLVMIRDVMALRCQASGHEYILEETLDHIERLLHRAQTQQITPTEVLQVPVFHLSASV